MQSQKESFLAFFSYVQKNDQRDRGMLTFLRKSLQAEIWAQTGKSFEIFQDYEHIEWGHYWKRRIKNVLDVSPLLIAIITPSYLESQFCKFEYEYFLDRESHQNRNLIIPILYIDTPSLSNKKNRIAHDVSNRQWVDWRDLRFASRRSKKVDKRLEALAKHIRNLIDKNIFVNINNKSESEYTLPGSVLRKDKDTSLSTPNSEAATGMVVQAVNVSLDTVAKLPSLYAPAAHKDDRSHPPQLITVLLRPTGDRERDKRRIKTLYASLISFHGRDKFSFQIFEDGKGHLIDFPNDTTRVCPEMLARLKKLMGEESWRIDEITFL